MCVWVQIELIGDSVNFNFCENLQQHCNIYCTVFQIRRMSKPKSTRMSSFRRPLRHCSVLGYESLFALYRIIQWWYCLLGALNWKIRCPSSIKVVFHTLTIALLSASCSWFKGLNNCFCDMMPENIMTLICDCLLSRTLVYLWEPSLKGTLSLLPLIALIACSTCIGYRCSGHLVE